MPTHHAQRIQTASLEKTRSVLGRRPNAAARGVAGGSTARKSPVATRATRCRPVPASTAANACVRLCVSAPITITRVVPFVSVELRRSGSPSTPPCSSSRRVGRSSAVWKSPTAITSLAWRSQSAVARGLRRSGHWRFPLAETRHAGFTRQRPSEAAVRSGGVAGYRSRRGAGAVASARSGLPARRSAIPTREGALTMRWLQAGDISAASRPSILRSSRCCRLRPDQRRRRLVERQQPARCDAFWRIS